MKNSKNFPSWLPKEVIAKAQDMNCKSTSEAGREYHVRKISLIKNPNMKLVWSELDRLKGDDRQFISQFLITVPNILSDGYRIHLSDEKKIKQEKIKNVNRIIGKLVKALADLREKGDKEPCYITAIIEEHRNDLEYAYDNINNDLGKFLTGLSSPKSKIKTPGAPDTPFRYTERQLIKLFIIHLKKPHHKLVLLTLRALQGVTETLSEEELLKGRNRLKKYK